MESNKSESKITLPGVRFFPFNPKQTIQNQQELLVELDCIDTEILKFPHLALKQLALNLFEEGSIDKAIEFCKEALKIEEHCFNCTVVRVSNANNMSQLTRINEILPQAIILSSDVLTNENRQSLAHYYRSQALKKMVMPRLFSALRLFEEALKCDSTILGDEVSQVLPYDLGLIAYIDVEEDKKVELDEFMPYLGVDYVYLNPICLSDFKLYTRWVQLTDLEIIMQFNETDKPTRNPEEFGKGLLINIISALGYINLLKWMCVTKDYKKLFFNVSDKANGWAICPTLVEFNSSNLFFLKESHKNDSENDKTSDDEDWLEKKNLFPAITPLMTSVLFDQPDIFKLLLANGADIHQLTMTDIPLLLVLTALSHLEGIKKLHEQGVDLNLTNSEGTTALMVACYSNWKKGVKYLIENHANVNEINLSDFTALMYASDYGVFERIASSILSTKTLTKRKAKMIRFLLAHHATLPTDEQRMKLDAASRILLDSVIDNTEISEESFQRISKANQCMIL